MSTQIKLPNLGENIESGDVLSILVSEGDTIDADQDILEVETDKATMPVPSPEGGRIVKILVREGETIAVGSPIMEIESSGEGASPAAKAEQPSPRKETQAAADAGDHAEPPAATAVAVEPPPRPRRRDPSARRRPPGPRPRSRARQPIPVIGPSGPPAAAPAAARSSSLAEQIDSLPRVSGQIPGDGHSTTAASPTVRRLARQLGVDLRRVNATGEGGRISAEDVKAYVRKANEEVARAAKGKPAVPGEPDADNWGPTGREKMSRLRRTIAENMLHSYSSIPQLTNFDDADTTELEQLRQESKRDYADRGIKLTSMPFLVKAVASALKKNPVMNASLSEDQEHIIYKEYISIGIAVDTPRGLIVPVLRNTDRKTIPQIAEELAELATSAREGSFTVDDLKGGTFTISNLGAIGGTYSTPIINPPQVGILLAGRSRHLPMYVNGDLARRLMMPLSITYDHRIVDGAAAARFLNDVKEYLSAPGRLLLAP